MTRRDALLALVAAALLACTWGGVPPLELAPGERLVIDVREPEAFAAGHHAGALNLQLGWRQLAARTPAYVRDRDTPLAVHAEEPEQLASALEILRALGYRDVAVAPPPADPRTLEVWSASRLRDELDGAEPPVVLDVRSPLEFLFRPGDLDGAVRVDPDRAPAAVAGRDPRVRYAVICEGGWRSSQLASWMRRLGFGRVVNVVDGMAGWRSLPPVER